MFKASIQNLKIVKDLQNPRTPIEQMHLLAWGDFLHWIFGLPRHWWLPAWGIRFTSVYPLDLRIWSQGHLIEQLLGYCYTKSGKLWYSSSLSQWWCRNDLLVNSDYGCWLLDFTSFGWTAFECPCTGTGIRKEWACLFLFQNELRIAYFSTRHTFCRKEKQNILKKVDKNTYDPSSLWTIIMRCSAFQWCSLELGIKRAGSSVITIDFTWLPLRI